MSISPKRTTSLRFVPSAQSRLAHLARTLFIRLFTVHVKRYFSSYLQRWHLVAAVLKHIPAVSLIRPPLKKAAEALKVASAAKGKVPPPKVEIKSVRAIEHRVGMNTSPSVSSKKLSLSSAFKTSNKSTKAPEKHGNKSLTDPRVIEFEKKKPDSLQPKRPTSVPPIREEAELLAAESSMTIDGQQSFSGVTKTPRGKSLQRNTTPDVCTRLFNQAQELETKRAEMRKSLEPDYTFTPRLALGTNKWLSQKTAKSTPVKTRNKSEEVAVVSSSAVLTTLGRIGEMITPKVKDTLRLAKSRPDKGFRGPVIPLMPQETLVEEVEEMLSEDRWAKKSIAAPFSLTYSSDDLTGQYASFGMQIKTERGENRCISPIRRVETGENSPTFTKKENQGDNVFIDFIGEESGDSFFAPLEKPDCHD